MTSYDNYLQLLIPVMTSYDQLSTVTDSSYDQL